LAEGKVLDILETEFALRSAALADAASMLFSLLSGTEEHTPFCPVCGDAMHSQGRRSKTVVSALGEGTLERGYFECTSCHTHAIPKDGLLHIENTSYTPGTRRMVARLASLESFEEASGDMGMLCGVEISTKEVERIAEAVGADIECVNRQRTDVAFADGADGCTLLPEEAIPRMYIECDGTGVPMTAHECEGRVGKQVDGASKTREAKLGCIFTQSSADDEGRPVRDKGSTTYFGAIECAGDFGKRLYTSAVFRGIGCARQVVVIGDGAKWIWNLADLHFPGAVQIVDLFHAKEHVSSLIGLLVSNNKQRARRTARCYTLLEKGTIAALIKQFRSLPVASKEQQDALDREVGYFTENAERMRYAKFKRMCMFVGSGVIEAGCKNVIGKRLKQSGMHWSVRGANAIIALRCSIMSETFDKDFESLLAA
jgi:hypothetical protein